MICSIISGVSFQKYKSCLSFPGYAPKTISMGGILARDGARLGSNETVSVFYHQNSETLPLTETVSKVLESLLCAKKISIIQITKKIQLYDPRASALQPYRWKKLLKKTPDCSIIAFQVFFCARRAAPPSGGAGRERFCRRVAQAVRVPASAATQCDSRGAAVSWRRPRASLLVSSHNVTAGELPPGSAGREHPRRKTFSICFTVPPL